MTALELYRAQMARKADDARYRAERARHYGDHAGALIAEGEARRYWTAAHSEALPERAR